MIRNAKDLDVLIGKKIYLVSDESDIVARLYPILKDKGIEVEAVISYKMKHAPQDTPKYFCGLKEITLSEYDGTSKMIVCTLEGNRRKVVSELLNHDVYNFMMLHASYEFSLLGTIPRWVLSYFKDTNYFAYGIDKIENYHSILANKNNPKEFKARFYSFEWFPMFQKYCKVDLKTDELQNTFEKSFGKYTEVESLPVTEESKKKFEELCTIYSIRSHFDTVSLNDEVPPYITPLQAGAALTDKKMCDLKDNTGDNISERNADFSECSAIYWAWKNGDLKKYVGVCHYRRFLSANTAELVSAFEKDVDVVNTIPTIMFPSIKKFFIRIAFYKKDYTLMQEAIQKMFPEYVETEKQLGDGFFYLACNIFVMKREWFNKLCEFVFGVLLYMDDYYHEHGLVRGDRYAGYYFEYLYSVFIMKHADELKIEYTNMGFLSTKQVQNAYYSEIINTLCGRQKEDIKDTNEKSALKKDYELVADNGISYSILYVLRMGAKKFLRWITGKKKIEEVEKEDNFDFPSINDD